MIGTLVGDTCSGTGLDAEAAGSEDTGTIAPAVVNALGGPLTKAKNDEQPAQAGFRLLKLSGIRSIGSYEFSVMVSSESG